jgi:hypothetical protein
MIFWGVYALINGTNPRRTDLPGLILETVGGHTTETDYSPPVTPTAQSRAAHFAATESEQKCLA